MRKMLYEMRKDKLAMAAGITACVWIIIQVVLIITAWDHFLAPDEKEYMRRALFAYNNNVIYPSVHNLNDMFTHAPGLVNLYMLIYAVFKSFKIMMLINLLMNIAILYEVYYIAKTFFSKNVGYVAVIIYCTIVSTWFVPLHYLSDHPSYFLFISGFCLTLQKKWYFIVLGAICYALSYTIRPTVLAYLMTSIIFMIANKRSWKYYVCLLVPYFGILYGIGKYFENEIGIYTNTSHITGFGMAHSANDETWAGPDMSFYQHPDNSAYIENSDKLNFAEKDSIWKERAIQWVIDNPERYAMLAPKRFFRSYALDDWSTNDIFTKDAYGQAIKSDNPQRALTFLRVKQFMISVPYYIMLLLFAYSLCVNRKEIFTRKGIILFITLFYTGTTFLLLAEHRSHYAFIFPMIIWAAYGVEQRFHRSKT